MFVKRVLNHNKHTYYHISFYTPVEKRDVLCEHPWRAGVRAGGGVQKFVCTLTQTVFVRSSSNLLTMLIGIISRPSSIIGQIGSGLLGLWSFFYQKNVKLALSVL